MTAVFGTRPCDSDILLREQLRARNVVDNSVQNKRFVYVCPER